MVLRRMFMLVACFGLGWILWRFRPLPPLPDFPADYQADRAAWLSIDWVMSRYSEGEIVALVDELITHNITHAFVYVSYLKSGDYFNPTYTDALTFTKQFKSLAPEITLYAWIGIPVQITELDGTYADNRLESAAVRSTILEFSLTMLTNYGFDGVHLNAEQVPDSDESFLLLLRSISDQLPDNMRLSVTAHPLQVTEPVTAIPYPRLRHHWTPAYLPQVAQYVDQIALMAYDSGLFFPEDYRNWLAFQVRQSASALKTTNVHLLIGLPASEEWTPTHQLHTEYLENALHGYRMGLSQLENPNLVDGIALYPHWEIDSKEWDLVNLLP